MDRAVYQRLYKKAADDAALFVYCHNDTRTPVYASMWMRGAMKMLMDIRSLDMAEVSKEYDDPDHALKVLEQFKRDLEKYLS